MRDVGQAVSAGRAGVKEVWLHGHWTGQGHCVLGSCKRSANGGTSIERRVFVYVRSPYNIEYRRWAKQKGAERARGPFRKDEQVKLFWESRKEEQITWWSYDVRSCGLYVRESRVLSRRMVEYGNIFYIRFVWALSLDPFQEACHRKQEGGHHTVSYSLEEIHSSDVQQFRKSASLIASSFNWHSLYDACNGFLHVIESALYWWFIDDGRYRTFVSFRRVCYIICCILKEGGGRQSSVLLLPLHAVFSSACSITRTFSLIHVAAIFIALGIHTSEKLHFATEVIFFLILRSFVLSVNCFFTTFSGVSVKSSWNFLVSAVFTLAILSNRKRKEKRNNWSLRKMLQLLLLALTFECNSVRIYDCGAWFPTSSLKWPQRFVSLGTRLTVLRGIAWNWTFEMLDFC